MLYAPVKTGVMIKVDRHSDGNINFTGNVGAELDDSVAPTTTPHFSGVQLPTGSYLPGAILTLIATDNTGGIGVEETEYSLDYGSSWTTYKTPLAFNEVGEMNISYHSRDGLGNLEATQSLTISIAGSSDPTVNRGGK